MLAEGIRRTFKIWSATNESKLLVILQKFLRNFFTVEFIQLGLGIKEIDVRRPTRHEEKDHALRLGRVMKIRQTPLPCLKLIIQQGSKCYGTNPTRRATKKGASCEVSGEC